MKQFRLRYQDRRTLQEVGKAEGVCSNARFVFDQEITVWPNEELELDNGQWFLITNPLGLESRTLLSGKWDR